MYLLVPEDKLEILNTINSTHTDRKIVPIKSNNNFYIVRDSLLTDCENPENTWYDWKDWLASLSPTDDIPAPRPPRPTPKPKNP